MDGGMVVIRTPLPEPMLAWIAEFAQYHFQAEGKKKRGKKAKVGVAAHDDLVRRDFTAAGPNLLWLTDISEHGGWRAYRGTAAG